MKKLVLFLILLTFLAACGKVEERKRPKPKVKECYATLTIENNWRWGIDVRTEPSKHYLVRGLFTADEEENICLKESDLHNGVIDLAVRPDGYGGFIAWYNVGWECGTPTITRGMHIKFTVESNYRFACSWL